MPLRVLLKNIAETVQELAAAASDRVHDGQALLDAGRPAGSIYISGYAAEMFLKCACARFQGALPTSQIGNFLAPLTATSGRRVLLVDPEGKHSVRFWAMTLESLRATTSPFPANIELEFQIITERLYNVWFVELRYRHDSSLIDLNLIARQMMDDVGWLHANYNRISMP